MKVAKHPTLNILVREDGAVLLPPCVRHPVPDWTFGRVNKQGYMEIKFMYKNYRIHKLLAETFIENPNGYKEVDHINRNRTDNRLQNLRWANRKMQADNKKSVDDSIKKYGKENAELKQKLEDAKASHYAEMVDAGMRERRLRRALFIAHAIKAKFKWWWMSECKHNESCKLFPDTRKIKKFTNSAWICSKSQEKCRAKAEQYK